MLYGRYQFKCTLIDDAVLPPYKGSTFRGAFGFALRRAVCVSRTGACSACLLVTRCIYAKTFEPLNAPQATSSGSATAPHPYVIEPPLDLKTRFAAGSPFDFTLLLFGETTHSLPYFVYAFAIMGESGIGRKSGESRARFVINEVRCGNQVIYDACARKLVPQQPVMLSLADPPAPDSVDTIRIRLLTPLRLKHQNNLSGTLPFHLLVRAMLRRVSSLFGCFGAGEPLLDYRGLVHGAQQVEEISSTLRWHDWERYSNRQEQAMLMGGLMGAITYRGEISPYLPLFEICKILHIGKQSSFGLGLFDYDTSKGDGQ